MYGAEAGLIANGVMLESFYFDARAHIHAKHVPFPEDIDFDYIMYENRDEDFWTISELYSINPAYAYLFDYMYKHHYQDWSVFEDKSGSVPPYRNGDHLDIEMDEAIGQ